MLTPFEEELDVGARFADRFSILGVVGRGSMGIVYQARHELMGRTVAIKMLRGQLAGDERSMRRFEREARAASRMDHPNLISVHDFGLSENRQPYLVMDFCQGSTLYEIQRRENHLTPVRAVRIFTQVCDALQHAHLQGVIHRDLKPSNIMILEKDGEPDFVKVFDLGIAKIAWGEEEDREPLTRTNEVCGSPIYLSPEQCKHETLDPRSDIYSLGVVMYELLTGLPPLMGETVYDTIYMHVHDQPRSFGEVRPDLHIPSRLERIVFKALEKNPDSRYQSMQELKWELQASLQASDPHLQVLPPDALAPKRKPRVSGETPAMVHQALREPESRRAASATPTSGVTPVRAMPGAAASMPSPVVPAAAAMPPVGAPMHPSHTPTVSMDAVKPSSVATVAVISSVVSVAITLGLVGFFILGRATAPSVKTESSPPPPAKVASKPQAASAPAVAIAPAPVANSNPASAPTAPPTPSPAAVVHTSRPVVVTPRHQTQPTSKSVAKRHGAAEHAPAIAAKPAQAKPAHGQPNAFFSIFQGMTGGQAQQPQQAPVEQPVAQTYAQQPAYYQAPPRQPAHVVREQPDEAPPAVADLPSPEAIQYNNEGASLLKTDPAAAIERLQQALAISPRYAKARSNLARAKVNLGNHLLEQDKPAAMNNYREAIRLFKESGDVAGYNAARDLYSQLSR